MKLIAMHASSLPEFLEYLIMSFHDPKMTDTGDIWLSKPVSQVSYS